MWTTPEKLTMRRETLGNANQNKTTKRAGYKKVYEKTHQKKHSELKEPHETLDKTKTLTARQKKAKEKALKWSIQTGKEPYRKHSEKNSAYNMLKETTKPLWRRVLIEEGLVKALKRITRRTQTSGIFVKQVVFHTVNHRGPLPLKELHSTDKQ